MLQNLGEISVVAVQESLIDQLVPMRQAAMKKPFRSLEPGSLKEALSFAFWKKKDRVVMEFTRNNTGDFFFSEARVTGNLVCPFVLVSPDPEASFRDFIDRENPGEAIYSAFRGA